jgi:hypothetical protein
MLSMSGAELRIGALAALRRGQFAVLARGCRAPALREDGRLSHVARRGGTRQRREGLE